MACADFYRAVLSNAENCLKTEHKWIMDNLSLIEHFIEFWDEIELDSDSESQIEQITERFSAWSQEVRWFSGDPGSLVTFNDICSVVGVDPDKALSPRKQYLSIPIDTDRVEIAMDRLNERIKSRREANQRGPEEGDMGS